MIKIYPTIEANGTPGEISQTLLSKDSRPEKTVKRSKPVPSDLRVMLSPRNDVPGKCLVNYSVFELHEYLYKVAFHRDIFARVFVYVDQKFLSDDPDPESRKYQIDLAVRDLSPWFFTYGERLR